MKFAVFALLLVVAGAFALPQAYDDSPNHNVVEQQIRNIIRRISEGIQRLGLDPLEIESVEFEHVATPGLIEIRAEVEDLVMEGGSNIEINNLQYTPGINRLTFDVSLPELKLSLGGAELEIVFFEYALESELKGSLAIKGVRLAGEINLNINIIDGITVRSITLDFFGGLVESELSLEANDDDLSEQLNSILGEKIPAFLDDNRNEINRALETIVRVLIDQLL